ncbi:MULTISPECIES: hypothetical protein [Thermomonosporaceae]|uniref:hypothetical protein n=1 Tax=Thermomonosporaceae TaxID=2012 RepID=UPI00255A7F70|nr:MULTISPECIES: hypothetical protein [Thermomonosporaceae]MDL4775731.1 hypothetical protein [Actinomadura xylanilytica]
MRRIAAVALAAGTLMAGMAAVGAPAEAAVTKKWAPYNKYSNLASWGTYTRSGGSVYVSGYLQDSKKNGWTACVRFKFTEGGKAYWSRHKIVTSSGANFDNKGTVSIKVSSSYSSHLYVQECGRSKKSGQYVYGPGKTLF